jgi:hypothetical protein
VVIIKYGGAEMMKGNNIKKIISYLVLLIAAMFALAFTATMLLRWYYKF